LLFTGFRAQSELYLLDVVGDYQISGRKMGEKPFQESEIILARK
jgi:hypothetical protein